MKPRKQRRLYRGPALDSVLGVRLSNALIRGGIATVPHLVDVGVDAVILCVPDVGERSREELEAAVLTSGVMPLDSVRRRCYPASTDVGIAAP